MLELTLSHSFWSSGALRIHLDDQGSRYCTAFLAEHAGVSPEAGRSKTNILRT